ncbi:MAG: gas vesicle protein GvpN [Phormidium tanganyikae FI6-MK23]|jgi:gas vesicle protein GvpN|nr:gas vesicle protein GvpN [Phormidium tanganyikae FI6-MK23]
MTTVLRASPRRFVSTPAIERIAARALRYLQSGFSVHLRGCAGVGKTTLALHLADMLSRPIMLMYGDDDSKSSDLIGSQSGYTRKKVVDNFIHSVIKVQDEMKHTWVDSRLTLACREGFTLVYDEFNRSRPEVNNVLLSALEEKLLVLPPTSNQTEYVRVNPQFRAILTSNPEEYCGVHSTQDALMDRLVTINIPEPDELTQQEILIQKTEIDRSSAAFIVRLIRSFWQKAGVDKASGLRSALMIAKVCKEHNIPVMPEDAEFRGICSDVLLSRVGIPIEDATKILWELQNEFLGAVEIPIVPLTEQVAELLDGLPEPSDLVNQIAESLTQEQQIYRYLVRSNGAGLSDLESEFGIVRTELLEVIRALTIQGLVIHRDRQFFAVEPSETEI